VGEGYRDGVTTETCPSLTGAFLCGDTLNKNLEVFMIQGIGRWYKMGNLIVPLIVGVDFEHKPHTISASLNGIHLGKYGTRRRKVGTAFYDRSWREEVKMSFPEIQEIDHSYIYQGNKQVELKSGVRSELKLVLSAGSWNDPKKLFVPEKIDDYNMSSSLLTNMDSECRIRIGEEEHVVDVFDFDVITLSWGAGELFHNRKRTFGKLKSWDGRSSETIHQENFGDDVFENIKKFRLYVQNFWEQQKQAVAQFYL